MPGRRELATCVGRFNRFLEMSTENACAPIVLLNSCPMVFLSLHSLPGELLLISTQQRKP